MTDWYSEHFSADTTLVTGTTTGAITADDPPIKAPPGSSHAIMRMKRSLVDFSAGDTIPDASTCRMFTLKSSDRIYRMILAAEAGWSASADLDIGTYFAGDDRHTGAQIDVNTFGEDINIGGGIAYVDQFVPTAGGGLEEEDRGKKLWELIEEVETQSWTVDPIVDIDIVIEFTGTLTTALSILLVCEYTGGMN
jgi:hypothetical protein